MKPSSRSFSTIKLFKACNFCRRRKIKCVNQGSNICENCKVHNEPCIFEHKTVINGKEVGQYKKSDKIKRKVQSSVVSGEIKFSADDLDTISFAAEYNFPPFVIEYLTVSNCELENLYKTNIELHTPFLPSEIFTSENPNFDDFSKICINIASELNPNSVQSQNTDEMSLFLNDFLNKNPINWNICTISCFLLLPLKIHIEYSIIEDVLNTFKSLYSEDYDNLPDNLVLGVLANDSWTSLIYSKPSITKSLLTKRACKIINSMGSGFQHHFLYIAYFINQFLCITEGNTKDNNVRKGLLQLEYDMLLWPAKLEGELSLVEDKYNAKPEAIILHLVHNVLLLSFYTNAIENEEFGELSSISPVPGLYHFLCTMASSNFRIYENLRFRWNLLDDCNILVAKLLLSLNKYMDFDFLKITLHQFEETTDKSQLKIKSKIHENVKVILSESTYYNYETDGALVYWVFRDTRSMSLQSFIYHNSS